MGDLFGLFYRDQLKGATLDEFENMGARLSTWALREHNEDGTHNVRPSGFDFVPIGAMLQWLSNTPPSGWLVCDGSQVSRTTYQAVFNILGTTYGVGDGSTTFNLPDLRQRLPMGKAAAGTASTLGSTGGAIDHSHSGGAITGSTAGGTTGTGTTGGGTTGGGTTGGESGHTHGFGPTDFVVESGGPGANVGGNLVSLKVNVSGTTGTGSGHDHSVPGLSVPGLSVPGLSVPALGAGTLTLGATGANNPPYVVVNYIILTGV